MKAASIFQRIAILWAGLTLGGSMLAAPAKFQVESLSLPLALQVGRVQFLWVWYGELCCLGLMLVAGVMIWRSKRSIPGIVIGCFALVLILFCLQHLLMMPLLQTRSARILAGEQLPDSPLHLIYIVVEAIKFFGLILIGFRSLNV